MPEDEVGQQDSGGIGGALSRPIGPLPVWGWLLIVVGGYVVYKIVTGGGLSGGSNTGTAVGFTPTDTTGSTGDTSTTGSTDSSGATTPAVPFDPSGLEQAIANVTNIQSAYNTLEALQQKLNAAINTRDQVAQLVSKYQNDLIALKDAYARCKTATCRAFYAPKIAAMTKDYTGRYNQLKQLNATVTTLQRQVAAQQQSIQIMPPTPTSGNQFVPSNPVSGPGGLAQQSQPTITTV